MYHITLKCVFFNCLSPFTISPAILYLVTTISSEGVGSSSFSAILQFFTSRGFPAFGAVIFYAIVTTTVWLLEVSIKNIACVHGSTNGTNGRPISFKVLPMVPLVIPLVPLVPLIKTDGSQYCRQSTVWAKLPTLQSPMIKYGVLNFKFINFTNKHCFYQDDIRK